MLEQDISLTNSPEEKSYETIFSSLIEVLKKELVNFQDLQKAIINEKKILIKPSLDELNHVNALKENIILKARILEEVRTKILKKIARNLDIDDGAIKLMSLARYAIIEQKQTIENLKNDLLNIARDISKTNDENKYILDISINNVKGSIELISSLLDQSGVYLGNGKINEFRKNGRLLRTEG